MFWVNIMALKISVESNLNEYIDGFTWVIRYIHYKSIEYAADKFSKKLLRVANTKGSTKDPYTDRTGKLRKTAKVGQGTIKRDTITFKGNVGSRVPLNSKGKPYGKYVNRWVQNKYQIETDFGNAYILGYYVQDRRLMDEFWVDYAIKKVQLEATYSNPSLQQIGALRRMAKKWFFA